MHTERLSAKLEKVLRGKLATAPSRNKAAIEADHATFALKETFREAVGRTATRKDDTR